MFGGSAAVLINREPAPVETYNDLDSELVNFFATLRHPENGERLLKEIALTPFSREELALARVHRIPNRTTWSGRGGSTCAPARPAPDWRKPRRKDAGHSVS